MKNPLLKKLLIKSGQSLLVVNEPGNWADILGELPADITMKVGKGAQYDAVLLFARDSRDLKSSLPKVIKKIVGDPVFWVIHPKKNSGIDTDLDAMKPWAQLDAFGMTPVASAGVNDTWTALRIRPVGLSKSSGMSLDDIEKGPYADFIDIKNRTVTMPDDLLAAVKKVPAAIDYFAQLSFTNKKEYVLWILTAKQEKTRTARIEKSVEQLSQHKKNPSEK